MRKQCSGQKRGLATQLSLQGKTREKEKKKKAEEGTMLDKGGKRRLEAADKRHRCGS